MNVRSSILSLAMPVVLALTGIACDGDAKKDAKADEKKADVKADVKADDAKAGAPTGAEPDTKSDDAADATGAAGDTAGGAEPGADETAGTDETAGADDDTKAGDKKADDEKADDDKKADDKKADDKKADDKKADDKKADDKKADEPKTAKIDAKALFGKKCKSCHGASGDAKTKLGEKHEIADWTQAGWKAKWPRDKVVGIVTNGKSGTKMKPFKDKLSKDEILALADYSRKLGK